MQRLLLAAAFGLLALATPAQAHPSHHYAGGCGFTLVNDGVQDTSTTWHGEVHVAVVATDTAGVPSQTTPISAECRVYVDGVLSGVALRASGTGAAVNADIWTFYADPDDAVTLCTVVTVGGSSYGHCTYDGAPLLPDPVHGAVDWVSSTLSDFMIGTPGEYSSCQLLPRLAPGVPGVVDVTPEGDIVVAGQLVFDCPPYEPW